MTTHSMFDLRNSLALFKRQLDRVACSIALFSGDKSPQSNNRSLKLAQSTKADLHTKRLHFAEVCT